jgi:hypothetical protein
MYLMATIKSSKYLAIALTVLAVVLAATTYAAINVNQNVSSNGSISTSPNIGVYSDSACTTAITSINWGSLSAADSSTYTVYVKNTGTASMTLSMTVSNWSPAGADTYLTVSWNQQGTELSAGQSVAAIITLTVSPSVTGITNFSNTITLTGTG